MTRHLDSRRAAFGALLLLAAATGALAQDRYPSRPITIVVGYPAGGSTDLTGRVLGAGAGEAPRRDRGDREHRRRRRRHRRAEGGQRRARRLHAAGRREQRDRHQPAGVECGQATTLKDFTPIGLIASQPMVLVASQKSGVRNVDQFMVQAKKNPGKYSYGSSGVGTALHLAGEMIKDQGGLFMTHIPYRGVGPLTNDLRRRQHRAGRVRAVQRAAAIRSGKVVALGTTEAKRSPRTPDIPALAEHPRLKGLDINIWFALMGPAGLPEPVVSAAEEGARRIAAVARTAPQARGIGLDGAGPAGGHAAFPEGRDRQVPSHRRLRQDQGVSAGAALRAHETRTRRLARRQYRRRRRLAFRFRTRRPRRCSSPPWCTATSCAAPGR